MTPPRIHQICILLFAVTLGALIVICEPVSLPTTIDFSSLYEGLQRAYSGKMIYHLDRDLIDPNVRGSELRGAFPFPGPPWYLVVFYPLGLLSPEKAALSWALLNVGFLSLTVALTCGGLSARAVALITSMTLIAAPVQGHLIVGQFSLIVGLGVALTLWASTHKRPGLVAVGLILTTLKPHIGLPFVAAFLVWGARGAPTEVMKQAGVFVALLVVLLLASLAIDPRSLSMYPGYLTTLNSLPVNKVCDTCSSIPILVTDVWHLAGGDVWRVRFVTSILLGTILILPLIIIGMRAPLFVSAAVFAVLLSAPYLRNYDYVLLITPLLITAQQASQVSSLSTRRMIWGVLTLATIIAGVLPYLTGRVAQGRYLWVAPLLGYVATVVLSGVIRPVHRSGIDTSVSSGTR
jgi:hypothetical protein